MRLRPSLLRGVRSYASRPFAAPPPAPEAASIPAHLDHSLKERTPAAKETLARPRRKIEFATGDAGPSRERLAWFGEPEESGAVEVTEGGFEVGRIIEVRRNNMTSLGLVLASVLIAGRKRLVMLQASGEIWPVSENDVSFVMPASLVPAELTSTCWTPELLKLWSTGRDIGLAVPGAEEGVIGAEQARDMFAARRKVATLLRKVARETERMAARLTSGSIATGRGGGMEAVWEHFVPRSELRGGVTCAEVAEFLLNPPGSDKHVGVKPSTLPAFAANTLLMSRPDLFLIDERNMYKSGFLVRSRAERARIERVKAAVENDTPMFTSFITKANAVREALASGTQPPQWSDDDLDIIWLLMLPFAETRSTQAYVANPIAARIVKSFGLDMNITTAADVTAPLLGAIGVLPPADSLRTSMLAESAGRAMAIAGVRPEVATDLATPTPADAALDSLREDFSHRVYVIDDADAKELDDGIALERTEAGYWVHVHVADPTRFIPRDGALATHASFHGSSTYFPEGSTPLLPPGLGGGELSLGESNKSQSVMVFSARVDMEGNVLEHRVRLGALPRAVLTTYTAVNEALGHAATVAERPLGLVQEKPSQRRNHTPLTPDDVAALATLRDLANALRAKRFAARGLEWQLPSGSAIPLGAGRPISNIFERASLSSTPTAFPPVQYDYAITARPPTQSAENTVAEFMVLANRVVAAWCAERGIPVPFRGSSAFGLTSATPRGVTLDTLLAQREAGSGLIDPFTVTSAFLTPAESTLAAAPQEHWIMGVDAYVRATSPLRRFDDMLVHWQIKAALAAEANLAGKALDETQVLTLAARADAALNRIKLAQRTAATFLSAGLFRHLGPGVHGDVDFDNLLTRVYGAVEPTRGGQRVQVLVPQLGILAALGGKQLGDLPIGASVRARMDMDETRQWPNPIIHLVPA